MMAWEMHANPFRNELFSMILVKFQCGILIDPPKEDPIDAF
jgi:hypothetical protein